MQVARHGDAESFLADAGDFLLPREAEHNLILGLTSRLRIDPRTYGEDPYVASVMGREAVLGNQLDPFPAINALLGTNAPRPKVGGA